MFNFIRLKSCLDFCCILLSTATLRIRHVSQAVDVALWIRQTTLTMRGAWNENNINTHCAYTIVVVGYRCNSKQKQRQLKNYIKSLADTDKAASSNNNKSSSSSSKREKKSTTKNLKSACACACVCVGQRASVCVCV